MNSSISTVIRLLFVAAAGIPLAAASAQQPGATPVAGGGLPPFPFILEHTRNGSPAQRAAEAAAAAVKWKKTQADIARGEALMQAGDLDAAINVFQQLTADDPEDALAYQRMAEAQTAVGELTDAAASYRTVLYKWPGKNWGNVQNGDPVIHMQFALLLLRLNQRAEALSVYQHGYQLLQSEEAPTATTPAGGPLPQMLISPDFTAAQLEAAADTVTAIHKYHWISQDLSLGDFQHILRLQPGPCHCLLLSGADLQVSARPRG